MIKLTRQAESRLMAVVSLTVLVLASLTLGGGRGVATLDEIVDDGPGPGESRRSEVDNQAIKRSLEKAGSEPASKEKKPKPERGQGKPKGDGPVVDPPPDEPAPLPEVNVRDFGATGDGSTNDSAAIQAANDAVAREGGGRVFFPPGTYIASGLEQDSFVEFHGSTDAVLKHADGTSQDSMISGRIWKTHGSIEAGSTTLEVWDSEGIQPGAVMAIRSAGAPDEVQATRLASSVGGGDTTLPLVSAKGLNPGRITHLRVGDEIVTFSGLWGATALNVQRGLFGTLARAHPEGTLVTQALRHYAQVVAVEGSRVTIDRPADLGVRNASVHTGSIGMKVTGLGVDGDRSPEGSSSSALLYYALARMVAITGNEIREGEHSGIRLDRGTIESTVAENLLEGHGGPLGSALSIARRSSNNVVRGNVITGQTRHGIHVDDRSVSSTEWGGPPSGNLIEGNRIDLPDLYSNSAILISGSSDNRVVANELRGTFFGIRVATTNQGPNPSWATGNWVEGNHLSGHHRGIWVSGSHNTFLENVITETRLAIADRGGIGNLFEGNIFDD